MSGVLDPGRVHVFSDFDGTITERDTLVFLGERLGGGVRMREVNDRLLRERKISLRQCVAANMRSIRAPWTEAAALLRAEVAIDPTFPAFAAWCAARAVPLTVLSAGFEEIVRLFLAPADFPGVDVRANRLRPDERRGWQCDFRDRTEYGHDKAAAVRAAQQQGWHTVFIGDGFSDEAPAAVADEVFAKARLVEHCRRRGIRCEAIRGFDDVRRSLEPRLATG